jgi:hypothetical protein
MADFAAKLRLGWARALRQRMQAGGDHFALPGVGAVIGAVRAK